MRGKPAIESSQVGLRYSSRYEGYFQCSFVNRTALYSSQRCWSLNIMAIAHERLLCNALPHDSARWFPAEINKVLRAEV